MKRHNYFSPVFALFVQERNLILIGIEDSMLFGVLWHGQEIKVGSHDDALLHDRSGRCMGPESSKSLNRVWYV